MYNGWKLRNRESSQLLSTVAEPVGASHFVTPSIFFHLTDNRYQITSNCAIHIASSLYKPLQQCALSLAFQPKSKHEDRNLLLLSKSYFWRHFTRKTCVNNACSTSESLGHLLSKNIISFAIWQFVWHWGALSQPKLAPTNPSLPYILLAGLLQRPSRGHRLENLTIIELTMWPCVWLAVCVATDS